MDTSYEDVEVVTADQVQAAATEYLVPELAASKLYTRKASSEPEDPALAAFDAGTQLAALNESRQAAGETALLQHGIGLHSGLVQYGNIGSRDRLDFTVIGSAVNMASRLEGLCGRLGEAIVLSSDLAAAVPDCTRSLGRFALKGIADEQEVFAPTERPG